MTVDISSNAAQKYEKKRLKIIPVQGLTIDCLQLKFVLTSKTRDTKTRLNIKNLAQSNLDIVP